MPINLLKRFLKRNKPVIESTRSAQKSRMLSHINIYDVMEKIEYSRDISYLPNAFCVLLSDNTEIKERVARSINSLVNSLPITRLTLIDELFRARTSLDWSFDWKSEEPNSLITPSMSEQEVITIFGLCSFHPNGYLREKAVKELAKASEGYEIPYLLIRLNDWVGAVREAAREAVMERLTPGNASDIIDNLPLLYRLANCSRGEHKNLIEKATEMLASGSARQELIKGLEYENTQVRALCFEIISRYEAVDSNTYLGLLVREPNSHTRLFALRQVINKISFEDFKCYAEYLLNDKYAPIRVLVYELYDKYHPSESKVALMDALLDKHISVRETARFLLKKKGINDFSAFYRDALDSKQLYGAICGLGETGTEDDAAYLLNYLDCDQTNLVRSTIKALTKLAFKEFKDTFVEMLADKRPGVSKEARLALYGKIDATDADRIYSHYIACNTDHTRKNAVLLLCSLSKWDSIGYIIELCAVEDEVISGIAKYYLGKWIDKFNRSFTVPSLEQIHRMEVSIDKYGYSISSEQVNWIKSMLVSLKKE